jgi:hypothetical protein
VQVWVFAEVHCKVVEVPMATVVAAAVKVRDGVDVVPELLPPVDFTMLAPWPQPASAATTTRMAPRSRCAGAASLTSWPDRPVDLFLDDITLLIV